MSHTEPHRLAGCPGEPSPPGLTRADIFRSLLWIMAVTSAVINMVVSYSAAISWVNLVCGAVTLVCGGILVARRLRGRR
ncbi:hypothetical protein [Streptomyces odontomachi]|uniref:hypothetical protein n=1 Tax=Streptomyces odontomachi TaxID=2944940 RepID=UPI00210BB000|nr:hypothetical protein [Streptomyces sp. ODS25]